MTLHIIPDWHDYSMILPEFNDSIHQAQLFLSQNQQVELILVDFLPNLRGILAEKILKLYRHGPYMIFCSKYDCRRSNL